MTPYVAAALASESAALRAAGPGRRNSTAFMAAARLGELIAAGGLDARAVEEDLVAAALTTGLSETEARATVRRGSREGMKNPRSIPTARSYPSFRSYSSGVLPALRPSPTRLPEPSRPPVEEVRTIWESALPVTRDPESVAWLRSRGLDPVAVEDWNLARAIPTDARVPRWAWSRAGRWTESGHRLLLRLFDPSGEFLSLRARRIRDGDTPKDLTPSGFEVRWLCMGDALALQVLRSGIAPGWWTPVDFVIVEGTPDFLTRASVQPDSDEQYPAVIGLFEGAWTPTLASRFPAGANIFVRNHADETGTRHVQRIASDLGNRFSVYRIAREVSP